MTLAGAGVSTSGSLRAMGSSAQSQTILQTAAANLAMSSPIARVEDAARERPTAQATYQPLQDDGMFQMTGADLRPLKQNVLNTASTARDLQQSQAPVRPHSSAARQQAGQRASGPNQSTHGSSAQQQQEQRGAATEAEQDNAAAAAAGRANARRLLADAAAELENVIRLEPQPDPAVLTAAAKTEEARVLVALPQNQDADAGFQLGQGLPQLPTLLGLASRPQRTSMEEDLQQHLPRGQGLPQLPTLLGLASQPQQTSTGEDQQQHLPRLGWAAKRPRTAGQARSSHSQGSLKWS